MFVESFTMALNAAQPFRIKNKNEPFTFLKSVTQDCTSFNSIHSFICMQGLKRTLVIDILVITCHVIPIPSVTLFS